MRYGKLTTTELNDSIINVLKSRRKETLLSSKLGEDCAVLNIDDYILLTSDPITCSDNAPFVASLALIVSTNDIAANGGEPVGAMITLLMPPSYTDLDVKGIMLNAEKMAEKLDIDILGGHTEFTGSVNVPIAIATVIGRAKKLLVKSDIKLGDTLIVTKDLGIEGSLIVSHDNIKRLTNTLTSEDKALLSDYEDMLSVVKEATILRGENISMMHDITEGGLLGAVSEVCSGNGLGAVIYEKDLPISSTTRKICKFFGLNPYKLISSGSMLIASSSPQKVIDVLTASGIKATIVGEVTASGMEFRRVDGSIETMTVETDEIYKLR